MHCLTPQVPSCAWFCSPRANDWRVTQIYNCHVPGACVITQQLQFPSFPATKRFRLDFPSLSHRVLRAETGHSVVAWIRWFTETLSLSQPVVCWEVVHTHFSRAGSIVALVCIIHQFPLENVCLSWPIWRSPHKAFKHSVFRHRMGSKHPHPEIILKPLPASPFMETLKTQMKVRDTQTCYPHTTPQCLMGTWKYLPTPIASIPSLVSWGQLLNYVFSLGPLNLNSRH